MSGRDVIDKSNKNRVIRIEISKTNSVRQCYQLRRETNSRTSSIRKPIGYSNLQAISLVYRLPTWHCPHLLLNAVLGRRCCWAPAAAAVDRYLPPAGRSAANPSHPAAVDRWDRRADVGGLRTIDRFIDREPATYDAGSVNTSGDSDVISFHIYASWFKRHLVGKTLRDVCRFAVT